ncbi:FAD dependent oxidoreductase [Sparassis latifolia]|uniref:FAD dependent oxidoreductase domain-containing protein n=1 Tax=Sparassis crispa TaxID=139825 RepID=A0A401GB05_9APHY|nr:hypothetical protein SCP_0205520 [Sparassis crispa]GBE79354.1 hypothetical protein SCP_0205520 [Sparassis crispa]
MSTPPTKPRVLIVGAGIFGLSTGYYLSEDGYNDITLFDQHPYDSEQGYTMNPLSTAASVDEHKIFRASYGNELVYQRLAYEAREAWKKWNEELGPGNEIFIESGMLRLQHGTHLSGLERRTQKNMVAEGLRETQYILSNENDVRRAKEDGWAEKLVKFPIPGTNGKEHFEAVLDTTAGFVFCSRGCAYLADKLRKKGAKFVHGLEKGAVTSFKIEGSGDSKRIAGIVTKDGKEHAGDLVIVAGGSATPILVPESRSVLEATAGSVAFVGLPPRKEAPELWEKYSPQHRPVIIGHDPDTTGKEVGSRSIYIFPRNSEGLVKIGYRVTKYTNYVNLPGSERPIAVPLRPGVDDTALPLQSVEAIKTFVSTFMPDLASFPIVKTRLCFYTDTADNAFLIDYVPGYSDTLFLCTGGSGHGAKFTPVLGKHVRDVIQKKPKTELTKTWRWRPELPLGNGLEEGPTGPRTFEKYERSTPADLVRSGW